MSDLKTGIEEELARFWDEQSIAIDGESQDIDDLVAAMDSFTATEVLESLEKMLGMELPSGELIRRGGYDNKDQFIEHLTKRVLEYVAEHRA